MNILFLHQNFPGQYGHLATALAAEGGHRVVAVGEHANVVRRGALPGVETLTYEAPAGGARKTTHPYMRTQEAAVRRGQQAARVLLALQQRGFVPDVVCAHPGWGEALFVKDIYPLARLLGYFEFYFSGVGSDLGFDPEYASTLDDQCRVRIKNATMLISLAAADAGVVPTRWQHSRFPPEFQPKISVVHEGINTELVTPAPDIKVVLPDGHTITAGEEVVTFIVRNLEPYRGFHVFLRMLPLLLARRPKAQVVIVGGDEVSYGIHLPPGKTYRQMLLAELGDALDLSRVHFTGRVPYPMFLSILRVSRVHAYLTYPFVLSWSMLEAMSAGCLVIGSRTPPVEEVIEDGKNGLLCDFFDREGWAVRIAEALEAGAKLDHVRAAARQTILERYDLKRICLPQQLKLVKSLA